MTVLVESGWTALAQFLVSMCLVIVHARVLLPRQPEPAADVPGANDKPSYVTLASWRLTGCAALLSLVCQPLVWMMPEALRAAATIWSSSMAVLVVVDAASTWIPRRLTWICLAESAICLVVGTLIVGEPQRLVGAGLAALVVSALFAGLWWIGAGLGFADVRIALGLGLVAGAESFDFVVLAVLAGTCIGALWGIVHRLAVGSGRAFAYAPALWSGLWLAQLIRLWM